MAEQIENRDFSGVSMTEDEDDLRELLEQLDDRDEAVEQMLEESSVGVEVCNGATDDVILQADNLDEREIEITPSVQTVETPTIPSIDVVKYHQRLDQVTEDVLSACRADRQETQDVIDLLRRQIDDAVNKNLPPARMWVDGLVKAVEVKAGINATAVKMVEANAKMLAATKAGVQILNQNIQSGTEDLEDVLSKPLTEFDEF